MNAAQIAQLSNKKLQEQFCTLFNTPRSGRGTRVREQLTLVNAEITKRGI